MTQPSSGFMAAALGQATQASERGEVPVGAVVVDPATATILAACHNLTETAHDPSAHAEMLAIRQACAATRSPRLPQCDLYVTLEPCAMCAAVIAHARVRRVYFGAYDPKGGAVEHGPRLFAQPTCHHRPEVIGGVMESDCATLLKTFFAQRR